MALRYPELFQPFKIGRVEIKNRICMSPMLPIGWFDENGVITDAFIDYYEARAKGGAGLIFTCGNVPNAHLEKSELTNSPFAHASSFVHQMKKLSDRLHPYGAKLFIQVWFGSGRVMFPTMLDGQPVAASTGPNRWDPSVECREMTTQEVKGLIQSVIDAAAICKQSGADGVDINGAYGGYMGDQFTTDCFNHRTDEFGGSMDGQLKVLTDIVKGIKEKCGKFFPVTVRFGTKHYMKAERQGAVPGEVFTEYGRDIEESIKMGQKLEEAGYDAFLMGNGSYDSFYWLYPPTYQKEGLWLDDVAKLTAHVNIPVISPGRILQPEMANEAVKSGKVTAVAVGRGMLADPEWANKAKLGIPEAIRPCIGCNAGCVGRIFAGLPMQCAVNADVFREAQSKILPADEPKKLLIIGGGIAGMECARIAARRGHRVVLYEKANQLGGVTVAASVPDFKEEDKRLLRWFDRELKQAGVEVHLGHELTLEEVEQMDVDEIVVATGTTPKMPPIPGIKGENVVTAIDVLLGTKEIGQHVAVIGGGQVGIELALWLKKQGKHCVIIEAQKELLLGGGTESICIANKLMLEDMLVFQNIDVYRDTKVQEIMADGVKALTPDGERRFDANTVVMAIGYNSNDTLYKKINSSVAKKVWCLGDAKSPSNIMFAVKDGNAVGRLI